MLYHSHKNFNLLILQCHPDIFQKIFLRPMSDIVTSSGNLQKGFPCSYSINWWTAVSLEPCSTYHLTTELYRRIFFPIIVPAKDFVTLTFFEKVFVLRNLHFLRYIKMKYLLHSQQWCHFTNFVLKLIWYITIKLCKPEHFPF